MLAKPVATVNVETGDYEVVAKETRNADALVDMVERLSEERKVRQAQKVDNGSGRGRAFAERTTLAIACHVPSVFFLLRLVVHRRPLPRRADPYPAHHHLRWRLCRVAAAALQNPSFMSGGEESSPDNLKSLTPPQSSTSGDAEAPRRAAPPAPASHSPRSCCHPLKQAGLLC
ncbi:hypothetical protein EJB05_01213, partial [Eragrostis curvula]